MLSAGMDSLLLKAWKGGIVQYEWLVRLVLPGLVIGGLVLGNVSGASAQSSPLQLPAVEVRGERPDAEPLTRQTSTFATTIDTSEATTQVDTVADVLAESVGVQVRRLGGLGAFSTASIRGSTPEQVEVYLDGILLNRANAGLVDLSTIPLDNIDRIEVYRGFAPLHLGAGSIGGAIQLRTRHSAGMTSNSASVSYGSFDTRKVALYRSQEFARSGYSVLFDYNESDNDFRFLDDNGTPRNVTDDEVTTRRNNDFRAFHFHTRGDANLAGWRLSVADDFFTRAQGVPGLSNNQGRARLDVNRNVATLRAEKKGLPWPQTDLTLQLSHTWEQEAFRNPEITVNRGIRDTENTAHAIVGRGLLTLYLEEWQQIIGVLLEGSYETFQSVDRLTSARGLEGATGPLQQRPSWLVALQDEIFLFQDRLSLRPLLRYQFVSSDLEAGTGLQGERILPASGQEHLWSPSLGVKYRLLSFLDLKSNVGRFQRVPTLFELFGDRGATIGNPELTTESSVNWDIGFALEWKQGTFFKHLLFEYAYFGRDVDDLILFVQRSPATARAENIGSATIHGHEIRWSVTTFDHIRLFGNYTYQDARDRSGTFTDGNLLPGRPQHEVYQGIELLTSYGKLLYELNYIDGNFSDPINAISIGDRLLHNLTASLFPLGKRLTFTVEVKNITDNHVFDFRGFPLPGRAVFGTIEGKF